MPTADEPTLEDEILARARIHARGVDIDLEWTTLEWDVSWHARRRAGACRWDGEVATIILSGRAYAAYDWETFAGVVRHELVHAWEFQQFGESGHGDRFRQQAAAIDAPRHCQPFTPPRYELRCLEAGCSWCATRYRASAPAKSPATYRCGDCGAAIEVTHVSSGRTWTTASGYHSAKTTLGEDW